MQDPNWQRIKQLFAAAAALPPEQHAAFLAENEPDPAIRAEVLSLLAAHSPTVAPAGGGGPAIDGPGSRIGPYKLLEVIGEGGYGTVYAAEQEVPVRRRVALKIVKAGMDSRQVIARFEQERQALALMDHPNIARVFDGGATPSGRPFFVMELVKGDPITEYCDREKLTTAERLRLFVDVGRAVQHAHQKGVIHRDLKPSNVLVTLVDGKAIAKVIDFGVAKATQGRLTDKTLFTEHKQMIGTPLYMSPEQAHISGVDVDTRSDVYSLGVLLYELLTGTTPFRKEELLEAGLAEMHRVLREVEPQKPSTRVATLGKTSAAVAAQRRVEVAKLNAMLRGDLDWIVMKCLEKERARRYETASDLVRDVERHLAGEAVLAAPPSLAYRTHKFVRRHRRSLAAATAVALVTTAGLVLNGYQLSVTQARERERLVAQERHAGLQAYTVGVAKTRIGHWEEAKRSLDEGMRHGHSPVELALARAELQEGVGEFEAAEQTLSQCRGLRVSDADRDLLDLLWFDPSRPRWAAATAIGWEQALRRLTESTHLSTEWKHYAQALLADSMPEALTQLSTVLAMDPTNRRAAELQWMLLLLFQGEQSALEAAEIYRSLWPNHDFGRMAAAVSLGLAGRRTDAERIADEIVQDSMRDAHEWLTKLALSSRSIAEDMRRIYVDNIFADRKRAAVAWSMLLLRVRELPRTEVNVTMHLRLHPTFRTLGKVALQFVPQMVNSFTTDQLESAALNQLCNVTGMPTFRAVRALVACRTETALSAIPMVESLDTSDGDLWMSPRALTVWRTVALALIADRAIRNVPGTAEQPALEALYNAAKFQCRPEGLTAPEVRLVLTLLSLTGQTWKTLEWFAILQGREDATPTDKADAAVALMRVNFNDLAAKTFRGVLEVDPKNSIVNAWLPEALKRLSPDPRPSSR